MKSTAFLGGILVLLAVVLVGTWMLFRVRPPTDPAISLDDPPTASQPEQAVAESDRVPAEIIEPTVALDDEVSEEPSPAKPDTAEARVKDAAWQERHQPPDLNPPKRLLGPEEYANSPEFNPMGIVLATRDREVLGGMIDEVNRQLGELGQKRVSAIDAALDACYSAGDYDRVYPGDPATVVETGTVVSQRSRGGRGYAVHITVRYGDSGELDQATDEMWLLLNNAQQDIKAFFAKASGQ